MSTTPNVLGALRRFLPEWLKTAPALSPQQRRALWAISHCRTAALGGSVFGCECGHTHFAFHSCNHKACPQCGREATRRWVQRELRKLVNAPYFLVTFTLPSELRECFFGPLARQAYDMFFAGASRALTEKLANDKGLRAQVSGFSVVLHTWNQRMEFHPHLHCLVPGAGLSARGKPVRVRNPEFLIYLPHLQSAFREHMRRVFAENEWQVDPQVWSKDWGVHIQPAGSGASALKYLGAYVARSVISDSRILAVTEDSVTFRWKDRSDGNRTRTLRLPGIEFARRYLRHVLPAGLRSIRYYGFCHPTAKANRMRVQFHTGMAVQFGAIGQSPLPKSCPRCPRCGGTTRLIFSIQASYKKRGPPLHTRRTEAGCAALPSMAA